MLLYCWGIHTQKEIESKDIPFLVVSKNKKALGEEEKEEEAPGKRHATGSGENRNTLTHFDRQHRGKAEREKGQSQNGSNVQRDLHCLT